MTDIKFKYIRDPRNEDRCMTVAYRPTGRAGEYEYAYAVNKPTRFICVGENKHAVQFERESGQHFEKAEGRRICIERLDNPRTLNKGYAIVTSDEKPIIPITEHMSLYSPHQIVRRIADEEFEFQSQLALFDEATRRNAVIDESVLPPLSENEGSNLQVSAE